MTTPLAIPHDEYDPRHEAREDLLERLPELMEGLYRSGRYYVSVPAGPDAGGPEAYWAPEVVDPDGVHRHRFAERDRYLGDVAEERAFFRTLPPGRALDAGCGLGWFLQALRLDGWETHGVELSERAAIHAARFADVHVGRLEALPYPDEHFDAVLCHHVIEHLILPEEGLRELWRVLRPGGHLVLGTPDFDSGAARRYRERYRLLHDPTHVSLFSSDSMHRFLRDHGFAIRRVSYPYFDTRHFTAANLERLLDPGGVSPPFYGSFMTFYAVRRT